jgi:cell division protein FtsZ
MGAAVDEAMTDRISVTVVAGRRHGGFPNEDISAVATTALARHRDKENVLEPGEPAVRHTRGGTGHRLHGRHHGSTEMQDPLISPATGSRRKHPARLRQGTLPLDLLPKGRFEKSEPTIHQGQDLDVPTYIRRGVALN